ncbi:MAG: malate synthase A [Nocardioides sp.]
MPTQESIGHSVEVTGPLHARYDEILTPAALDFLAGLHRAFEPRRRTLLDARRARHASIAAGTDLGFLDETRSVREADWQVAPPAPGLVDRRVEITGPTDAKMAINALNSGAKVWLADLEDANTPLWENLVQGQLNLRDAVAGTLAFTNPDGKAYRLGDDLATIVVRPRGWHLSEKHLLVDGERMSGSLVDFGLYFFHCARPQLERGSGPYFYLPKMESHLEARLWNEVFVRAQEVLGLPRGTIRATVLIETVPAAFEMDEILHELREHSAGLNAGRWDYMFSMIKLFRDRGDEFVLPDRGTVTMTVPFMRAYTQLLVRTCHRRGAHAIGGMAAFIPSKDEAVNEQAFAKVRDDKAREAADGFDGSWVAHPGMVDLCAEVFTDVLGEEPDQRHRTRDDVDVSAAELLDLSGVPGEVTEQGLRTNVRVGISYLEAWLRGIGAVGIDNLMEDAATAEISRSQVWQWLHHRTPLADGRPVTRDLVEQVLDEEHKKLTAGGDPDRRWDDARALFAQMALSETYEDFLTVPAYEQMP